MLRFLRLFLVSALFYFGLSVEVRASEDCSKLWHRGFPDRGHVDERLDCTLYRPTDTRLPSAMKIYIDDKLRDVPYVKEYAEIAAEAANVAYKGLKSGMSAPKITFVFYHRFFDAGGGPDTLHFAMTYPLFPILQEACPIILYRPTIEALGKEFTKQLIAHEVFHCFFHKTYPAQSTAAIQDEPNHWHYEGLAQFFSNLIYPTINWEYDSIFPIYRGDVQLVRNNPYRIAHFWQAYYNYTGGDLTKVFHFMANLPTTTGTNPIELLNRLADAPRAFHKFAEDASSDQLKDLDGSKGRTFFLPSIIEHSLSEDPVQSLELNYRTLSVFSHRLKLKPGFHYSIKIETPDRESLTSFRVIEEGPHYNKFPGNILSVCDQERTVEILVTSTSTDQSLKKAKLTVIQTKSGEECLRCQIDEAPLDPCLLGVWQVDRASYQQMKKRNVPIWGNLITNVGGEYYLAFGENKENRIYYLNFQVDYAGTFNGVPMTMSHRYQGEALVKVNAQNGKGCTQNVASLIQVVQTIRTPHGDAVSNLEHSPEAPGMNFKYQCSPRQLKFIYSEKPNGSDPIGYELIFTRP